MSERPAYIPRGACLQLLHIQAPEVLISGPAGTGKSVSCLMKLHLVCDSVPGVRALIVRRTHASLVESALVSFENFVLPPGHPARKGPSRAMRFAYHYPNGSELVCDGLDKPTKIFSTEFDIAYVQEAIELSEEAWETLGTRLRHGKLPYQQLLADTNPDKPTHWLKLRCNAGSTLLLESRHEDNPLLWDAVAQQWTPFARRPDSSGYMDRLDRLTGPRKERLRYGRWVQAEGLVWEEWDASVHVVDPFSVPEDWPRYWAVDFGYTDPFVCQWWAESPDKRLYLYRELVQTHLLVEDAARQIKYLSRNEPPPRAIVCDHDREGRETLSRHLDLDTDKALKNMEVGHQAVSLRLRKGNDGRPRLFVCRNALVERDPRMVEAKSPCGLIEEIDGYVWDLKQGRRKGEQPLDKDNHSCDATRYLVEWLDEPSAPLEIITFDLSPKKGLFDMAVPVRYPQIRYFPQSGKFQPQPVIRGQMVMGCPDFVTQEEAAWFVLEINRHLRLPPLAFEVPDMELRDGHGSDQRADIERKRDTVTTKLKDYLRQRPDLLPEPEVKPETRPEVSPTRPEVESSPATGSEKPRRK